MDSNECCDGRFVGTPTWQRDSFLCSILRFSSQQSFLCLRTTPRTDTANSRLTLTPLTWRIWWASNTASTWQTGFNSAFKGLNVQHIQFSVFPHSKTPLQSLIHAPNQTPNTSPLYITSGSPINVLYCARHCERSYTIPQVNNWCLSYCVMGRPGLIARASDSRHAKVPNLKKTSTYQFSISQHTNWRTAWRMKDQLDVTCYFISLLMCSTCFGH